MQNRKKIGSVFPSSPSLVRKMLANVNFSNAKVIIELGPGTGVITREIIAKMKPSCRLLVFELHLPFYRELQKEFKDNEQVILVNDTAEKIAQYLESYQLGKADNIISSLPLANFDKTILDHLLKACHDNLKNEGKFIQFQYSLTTKKSLRNYFPKIEMNFTSMNIPPAFIFTCLKK
jgi:phospholipid N-methyltransferase